MPSPSEIAKGLTLAQRRAVLQIGDDMVLAGTVNAHTGTALFKRGLTSMILAGYRFTNLTDLGLAVRDILKEQDNG